MNNFTKKSGRAYWDSITNLMCCSPGFRELQSKGIKALTLIMFFAMGTGAMFAQQIPTEIIIDGDVDGCMHDIPAPSDDQAVLADIMGVTDCEGLAIHAIDIINDGYGVKHQETGLAEGSDHCGWTYYYVYDAKCGDQILRFTLTYSGGDQTPPKLTDPKKYPLPSDQKGLDVCYDKKPVAPTAGEIAALYSDNCDHVKVDEMVSKRTRTKNDDCGWIEINTYTIQDYCKANAFEVSITYSGADVSAPTFDNPPADIEAKDGVYCDEIPVAPELSWSDNCTAPGKAKAQPDDNNFDCNGGYILRTWKIVDDCGNPNEYTQKIAVLPNRPVQFTEELSDIYVPCEDSENIDYYIQQELGYSNNHKGSCEVSGKVKASYTVAEGCDASFEVKYTYEDECNSITQIVVVNFVDDVLPTITTSSKAAVVECDGAGNVAEFDAWMASNGGGATAMDNCDTDLTWTNDLDGRTLSDDCGETGTIFVTFTVTDDCGNESKTGNTFTIVDTKAPTMTDAYDYRAVCDGAGNTEQYIKWLESNADATAKDDCSGVTWSHDGPVLKKDETLEGYLKDGCSKFTGSITVTFTAEDDCENSDSRTATFYIEDSFAPDITPAQSMTVECDATMNFNNNDDLNAIEDADGGFPPNSNIGKFHNWLWTNGGATASDVCSEVTWKRDKSFSGDDCERVITVTFTAYDDCGNSDSTTASFTIVDTLSPVITNEAQDEDYECYEQMPEDNNGVNLFQEWLNNNGGATAYDACDKNLTWTNDYNDRDFEDLCGNSSSITVVFTVTDDCGLSSSTAAEFAYIDTTAPEFNLNCQFDPLVLTTSQSPVDCPADAALSLKAGDVISVFDTWTVGGLEIPGLYGCVYDACTNPEDLIIRVTETTNTKDECNNTITVTFEAEDACGNVSKVPFVCTYIIIDDTAPVLTGNVYQFNISGLDACEAPAAPLEADIAAQFSDNCGTVVATLIDTNVISDDACKWATQFTYEIRDNCGNLYEYPVKVSYHGMDQSAPQPTEGDLPKGESGINDCLNDAIAAHPGEDPAKVVTLFTDNCTDVKDIQIWKSKLIDDTDYNKYPYGCTWAFHYEYIVTDDCGNEYKFNENFSGEDKLAPTLQDPGFDLGSLNVSEVNACKADGAQYGPSEYEIMDLFTECGNKQNVYVEKTLDFVTGDDCNWLYSYSFVVKDICGNEFPTFKVTVTGGDTTKPEFDLSGQFDPIEYHTSAGADCPADATISLNTGDEIAYNDTWYVAGIEVPSLEGFVSDYCTPDEQLIIRVIETTNSKDSCSNTITVTFELEDSCGNIADDVFKCTYIVKDDTNPTASNPEDLVVQCADDVPFADTKVVDDEADNCNDVTVTHVGDATDGGFPVELITRTYKVEDACGNSINVTQSIKVEDTIAPEIECPGDIVVDLTAPAKAGFTTLGVYNGKAYYLSDATFTGQNAFSHAEANGGFVVTVNDSAENTQIYNWAQPLVGSSHYWIGYTDAAQEGTFVWHNGETPGYTNWQQPQEPNNAGGEDCTEVNFFGTSTWNDIACGSPHRYVLEVGGVVVNYTAPVSYSDNCDPDPVVTLDAGLASGSVFPVGQTVVTYKVVDASGNDATCTFMVTVNDTNGDMAPPVATAPEGDLNVESLDFKAYPVPFNKDVNLNYSFKFDTDVTIQVYDTKGLLVLSKVTKGHKAGSDVTLPLSITGADQLYYVKVITNRGTVTKKIVSSNVNHE